MGRGWQRWQRWQRWWRRRRFVWGLAGQLAGGLAVVRRSSRARRAAAVLSRLHARDADAAAHGAMRAEVSGAGGRPGCGGVAWRGLLVARAPPRPPGGTFNPSAARPVRCRPRPAGAALLNAAPPPPPPPPPCPRPGAAWRRTSSASCSPTTRSSSSTTATCASSTCALPARPRVRPPPLPPFLCCPRRLGPAPAGHAPAAPLTCLLSP